MESQTTSLVNYNSPAGSPGVHNQLPQSTSLQPSPHINTEQIELSPRTVGILSEVPEETLKTKNPLESLVNPSLPSELGEAECAVLRGDAIGNTAYTHRWVLNTLLTITQALPRYLTTDDKTIGETTSNCPEATNEDVGMENFEKKPVEEDTAEKSDSILELAEDVENAACQLWDMTAEPDVVDYLLGLSVVDILHLAKDIITLSRAPRLTEVVVGVVANLCCQSVGCEKVIGHRLLLNSCLTLMHTTDDVPTLIEAFRFLRLLIWHLTYRMAPQDRSQCPIMIALKSHESLKEALVFMLKNSLSDSLLGALSEFLEALMYIWLPNDQCYMAAYYSESGLVEGVVEVIRHFLKQWEKSSGQELPKIVHRGVLILYSFVATPAVDIISSFDRYESLLEPILVSYVEHLAKVESVDELLEGESAERLTYALGLSELLVPTMRHPNILLTVGKLLALTQEASHHYTAIHNQALQDPSEKNKAENQSSKMRRRRISRSRSRRSRTSQEENMETDNPVVEQKQRELVGEGVHSSVVNKESDCKEVTLQNTESSDASYDKNKREICDSTTPLEKVVYEGSSSICGDSGTSSMCKDDSPGNNDVSAKLRSIVDSLIDYCVRVVRCCPDLRAVLTTLNECHVHEVQLFLRAVRSREPKLVGQLQEQLLDTGSHNRLVTILSDLYT
ncbi:uncharacterized protein LOC121867264 [Homarus americanus]|uniref:uncharacterized protein LOC121867264 n=1 Tax=Homarus americanus TaxID=6706 RepID=UPI001C44EFAF|nr:uncharacterized protein LOC121867264 [Homarus americanus]